MVRYETSFIYIIKKDMWDAVVGGTKTGILHRPCRCSDSDYAFRLEKIAEKPERNAVIVDVTYRTVTPKYANELAGQAFLKENIDIWEKDFYLDQWVDFDNWHDDEEKNTDDDDEDTDDEDFFDEDDSVEDPDETYLNQIYANKDEAINNIK